MAGNRARFEEALNRGHSHSWDQQWAEAIKEFQVAIAEIANEPAPYAGLGMAYKEKNQLKNALENYKLAARSSRGDVIYLRQVADVQRMPIADEPYHPVTQSWPILDRLGLWSAVAGILSLIVYGEIFFHYLPLEMVPGGFQLW